MEFWVDVLGFYKATFNKICDFYKVAFYKIKSFYKVAFKKLELQQYHPDMEFLC